MSYFHKLTFISLSAALIAIITGIWVFLISDNPVSLFLSSVIGVCCGTVAFFIFTDKEYKIQLSKPSIKINYVFIILFLVFFATQFIQPIKTIYLFNWLALPMISWFSFAMSLFFTLFASGFIIVSLLELNGQIHFSMVVILSVIISMLLSSFIWFFARIFDFSFSISFNFFALLLFAFVVLYFFKKPRGLSSNRHISLNLNVTLPIIAIIVVFVSLISVQSFAYQPFIRGDSWAYTGVSIAISKGGFNSVPDGLFYRGPPHFFETLLSSVTGLSGFPPVNSLMIFSLILAVLIPLSFYALAIKYVKSAKISIISTFIFVIASGFGWLILVGQKVVASYSPQMLVELIEGLAPKVLYDITQHQGIISEGIKTYGFGILAIIVLLYLFRSNLGPKVRFLLISLTIIFAFQYHLEEALIFIIAVVPAFLFLIKELKFLRANIAALVSGLVFTLFFNFIFAGITFGKSIFTVNLISIIALVCYFALTYVSKEAFLISLANMLKQNRMLLLSLLAYFIAFSIYTLIFYGYPNMTSTESFKVVSLGLSFPFYYYPVTFGIIGFLIIIGLFLGFLKEKNIILMLIIITCLLIFGKALSFMNSNLFFTGTKEWRVLYRVLPIPTSICAGWVLYKIISHFNWNPKDVKLSFNMRTHNLRLDRRFSSFILLSVIIFGIPGTIFASEYWMSSALSPYGNIHVSEEEIELANFLSQIPINSKVAVADPNSNTDALVHLAGAISNAYPNFMNLDRPETLTAILENQYLLLDKSQSLNRDVFFFTSYFPLIFSNSKYLLYELPDIHPPSNKTTIGYFAPQRHDSLTLQSYYLMSSLNLPYQIINGEIFDKSVIILPSKPSEPRGRSVLRFDGATNYVNLGSINQTSNEFTVSAWFKTSVTGVTMSLINKRVSGASEVGYRIILLSDNTISAEINDGSGTITAVSSLPSDGLWHNVMAVYGKENLSLYLDCGLTTIAEYPKRLDSIMNTLNLTLGSENGAGFFFNGWISNVRIYDRALTNAEIASQVLLLDSYPTEKGLILWLPMDEGAGNQIHDGFDDSKSFSHNGAWDWEIISNDVYYDLDFNLLMDWVENGGKLAIFSDIDRFNENSSNSKSYLNVDSIHSGSESFQLNQTIKIQSFDYPARESTVLGNYRLSGQDAYPFAIEEKIGKGGILYLYLEPIYRIVDDSHGSLIFDCNFLSVINEVMNKWGIEEGGDEFIQFNECAINRFSDYLEKSFNATGNISVNSTVSGSYLTPETFLAENIIVNKRSIGSATIYNLSVNGLAELSINTENLFSAPDKNSVPTYFLLQLTNNKITLKPDNGASIKVSTSKGVFTIENNEPIIFDSKLALLVIRNPSIYINGTTDLTLKGHSYGSTTNTVTMGKYVGLAELHIAYGDRNYFFFDKMLLPPAQSSYPEEYSIPWFEIIFSPFNAILVIALIWLNIKFRQRLALGNG